MWIYQHTHYRADIKDHNLGWTVGFYTPTGSWCPIRDCDTAMHAEQLVHYLNGGNST